jgi:prepilin-type N-terminal cleavage/methylation domain-containing protein
MRLRRGFTLIEAMATIVVLAALGAAASNILLAGLDGYVNAATAAQLHTEASIALDRIVRELRRVSLDSAADGIAPDIDSVTASTIAWGGDSSLALDGTTLMFVDDGAAAAVLLSDVAAFAVQCYDEDNTPLAVELSDDACDPIRRVAIIVSLERRGVVETLRAKVFIRSTMTGAGA